MFGLRNAAQTCKRFVDEITRGLDFVYAYIDDFLIASKDKQQHREHLRTLVRRGNKPHEMRIRRFGYHEPLTQAFKQTPDKSSSRQFRHLDYIGQFTTDIRYIKGQDNNVADALSRVKAIRKSADHQTLADVQENDAELCEIVNSNTYALRVKKIRFSDQDVEIYCDVSGNTVRPHVPKPLRRDVFNSLHGLSHPGIRATQNLVTTRFDWPSINKNCRNWTRQCIPCQRCKVTRHVSTPIGTSETLAGLHRLIIFASAHQIHLRAVDEF
jgi:hypothetical protein